MPDVFADYKCVTKSIYPARNVPERVVVPNKTTQPQIGNKRGINNSKKQEKTENTSKISIDRHLKDKQCPVDICDPQSSPIMRINTEAETSEDPRSIVLGNHDESLRVDEIAINFVETESLMIVSPQ